MYKLEVYLIRHGKTTCNEKRLYCGVSDIHLSIEGKRELLEFKALSDSNKLEKLDISTSKFKYPKCEKYYTSGAKRANETFEILYPKIEYEVIKEFFEYNFGDFEMKSYDMLKENQTYINWIMDKEGKVTGFNGESKFEYRERISKAFKNFLNQCSLENYKSVLLVSHGGTIGTILELFYSNEKSFYEWQPECGLGYKLTVLWDKKVDTVKIESNIQLK
ncbi:histidine phosphatase family protein [Clostridium gasigenes]|uniref:Alpha-ribazole phosphatase n=1 Tax=Clostridium gasigenes TaxID=94869 RepID=A0A1H0NKT9_9CLOT|nr:histidine phosphatase family protein [Clostridium gasigenes]MBB6623659.1 histidine phosphatase family protein [Clostridium gasigenes]MBU3087540.1 phosphoglycerate mutase family protein [Clostridium gasigenes]MBU3131743.1 phosphoglycerate mutase family protein [Clostridium gasigenes]SDO93289.1 alpha-ribazole phosphatase [Clostridium gasigenes]